MKRAAFVDHSFRTVSRSTSFLVDLLREKYQVDLYWDASWNNGQAVDLSEIGKKDYDLVLFFQMLPSSGEELEEKGIRNAVLVPMYDQSHWIGDGKWRRFGRQKFINFSGALHQRMAGMGLDSLYLQYFCPPMAELAKNRTEIKNGKPLRGFFWQRYELVNWNHISSLIKHSDFEKIHIHRAIDPPGYEFYPPTTHEMEKYNITLTDWFEERDSYLEILKDSDVFFAPRKYEGIGLSFIEAMSLGKCVVAPDRPTMSEYIRDGWNGLLYDLYRLKPLDFSNIAEISKNAAATAEAGYVEWCSRRDEILEFCERPPAKKPPGKARQSGYPPNRILPGNPPSLRQSFWNRFPRLSLFLHQIKQALIRRRD